MPDTPEQQESRHAVTCRTPGCYNEDYTLILVSPGAWITCGACGARILDIDPPLPEVDRPYPGTEPEPETEGGE